jgi:drug/metabolite transporter (DMT)-like permease
MTGAPASAGSRTAGLAFCMAGMILFCCMDAVVKGLGQQQMSVFSIAFVRYAGAALWLALYIVATRDTWPKLANWRRHATRATLMIVTATLFFYGVAHLPLAIVAALALSAPVYVSIFGIVFLSEKPTLTLGVAVALGIAGSLVIVFGSGEPIEVGGNSDILAWGAALLAPVAYAATIVLLKHHADSEGAVPIAFATSSIAGFLAIPLAVASPTLPPAEAWWQVVLVGMLGAAAFALLTTGLKKIPASVFAIVDYTSVLWAALLGYVFFAEVPQMRFWVGGALIIAACVVGMRADKKTPTVATA